jgi:hypothetical protein
MKMNLRSVSVVAAGFVMTSLAASTCLPDEVTLRNGGVLRGKITKSGANVAVTTPQGIRVVVERSTVQKIDRKSSDSASSKVPLSDAEEAWGDQNPQTNSSGRERGQRDRRPSASRPAIHQ